MHTHVHQESTANNLLHGAMHNQQSNQQTNNASIQNHSTNQLTWSCELCGRMFATRDEWSIHAKSHLEVQIHIINKTYFAIFSQYFLFVQLQY